MCYQKRLCLTKYSETLVNEKNISTEQSKAQAFSRFRARMATKNGRKVLAARRAKAALVFQLN